MKYLLFLILLTSFLGCRKSKKITNTEPSGPEYYWSNFMGVYDVYDTVNHTQWVMKMTHLYHSDFNKGNNDSVLIENFANKFNIRDTWSPAFDYTVNQTAFTIKSYHPIKDKDGFSWHINSAGNNPTTNINENVMLRDTIIINFQLSNVAWYLSEGVSYYACTDCKHIAVKRH